MQFTKDADVLVHTQLMMNINIVLIIKFDVELVRKDLQDDILKVEFLESIKIKLFDDVIPIIV
jgi:hypothetical protein